MKRGNIEIKAKCPNLIRIQEILQARSATFMGVDYQIDTYFKTSKGKLKLREAILPFEDGLMHYERGDKHGPKFSDITVFQTPNQDVLKQILLKSFDVQNIIQKKRVLFVIDNVRFHLDSVVNLGDFIEIEAQDTDGLLGKNVLRKQCNYYMTLLKINKNDLIAHSYSDLLLNNEKSKHRKNKKNK
jgi:adenylate cyclase class 2